MMEEYLNRLIELLDKEITLTQTGAFRYDTNDKQRGEKLDAT